MHADCWDLEGKLVVREDFSCEAAIDLALQIPEHDVGDVSLRCQ